MVENLAPLARGDVDLSLATEAKLVATKYQRMMVDVRLRMAAARHGLGLEDPRIEELRRDALLYLVEGPAPAEAIHPSLGPRLPAHRVSASLSQSSPDLAGSTV